jgi:hypothetical protein
MDLVDRELNFYPVLHLFDRSRKNCLCAGTSIALLAHAKVMTPSTLKITSDAMKQTFGWSAVPGACSP